jgi:uncharacterized protein (DUF2141 family)
MKQIKKIDMKRNTALWTAQVLLAVLFAIVGIMKASLPLPDLFRVFPWTSAAPALFVRFLGAAELAAALGLVLPMATGILPGLTAFTARIVTVVMILGTAVHGARGEWSIVPVPLLVGALSAAVARGRSQRGTSAAAPLIEIGTILLGIASLLAAAPAAANDAAPIKLVLRGVRSDKGVVTCLLFDKAEPFPTQHGLALLRTTATAKKGVVTCVFPTVRPGLYALAGFHDENSNGKLDMGLFGAAEGWFASRDARGFLAPPPFAKAKFTHARDELSLTALVVY